MQSKWLRLTRVSGGGSKESVIAVNFEWIANVESAQGYPAFENHAGARLVYHDDSIVYVKELASSIMAALNTATLA